MHRSTPNTCTVVIARTGKLPVTLLVKPKALFLLAAIAVLSPLAFLGNRVYSLQRQNQELSAQNQELSQAANSVFKEIENLDSEIELLRERAGLDEDAAGTDSAEPRYTEQSPQGGVSDTLAPAKAFEEAQSLLPELSSALDQQVKPALDQTLAEEFAKTNAVPNIRPVKADIDISSKFGIRRNPFGWGYEMHNGIDFAGPVGTPIHATAPGVVTTAEWGGGYGYYVVVDHGYGYESLYAHLSEMEVEVGEEVDRKDLVGLMGNTGRSTGPHLHYSVLQDGKLVDPADYLD